MALDQTCAAFVGVLIGSLFPMIGTILSNRAALRLERLRIHEAQRHAAYTNLFKFARRLRNRIFPLAANKRGELHDAIKEHFASYTDRIVKILDELDETYVCETHPDLVPGELIRREFYEGTLLKLVGELDRLSRKEMRVLA